MKCLHSNPSFEYHVSIAYMHNVPPITNQKRAQRKRHHPIRKLFSSIASKVWASCLSYFNFPSTLSTRPPSKIDIEARMSKRASESVCDIPFDSSVCIRRLLNIQAYCHEYTHFGSFIHRCMHTIRCANLYFGRKVGEYQRASYVEVSWLRLLLLLLYSSSLNRFNKSESTHMFHFASFVRSFVSMYVVWVMVFSMMLEIRKH